MKTHFDPVRRRESQTLAIGCFGEICREWLGDRLVAFAAVRPDVTIGIHDMTMTELISAVRSGGLALAVVPEPLPAGLSSMRLWRGRIVVAIGADHPLATCRYATPYDIACGPILTTRSRGEAAFDRFMLDRVFPTGQRPPVSIVSVAAPALPELLARGEGVALQLASQSQQPGAVVTRDIDSADAAFDVHAVWHADRIDDALSTLLGILEAAR